MAFLKALTFTKDFTDDTDFNKCRSQLHDEINSSHCV